MEGQHLVALREFCDGLVLGSRNFSRRMPPALVHTRIMERLVACCMALGAYIQAAVLCQFVTPIDHTTGVKAIQNACSNVLAPHAVAEGYFTFLHDITLLEILLHYYSKIGSARSCSKIIQLLGRSEFNEATDPALRAAAVATLRHDALRALCIEFSTRAVATLESP